MQKLTETVWNEGSQSKVAHLFQDGGAQAELLADREQRHVVVCLQYLGVDVSYERGTPVGTGGWVFLTSEVPLFLV